jgi:hypothetical protein
MQFQFQHAVEQLARRNGMRVERYYDEVRYCECLPLHARLPRSLKYATAGTAARQATGPFSHRRSVHGMSR